MTKHNYRASTEMAGLGTVLGCCGLWSNDLTFSLFVIHPLLLPPCVIYKQLKLKVPEFFAESSE